MEWKRKSGEDLIDYKVRLAENKYIYKIDWYDIADLINKETGNTYGESAYRKEMTSFLKGKYYQMEKSLDKDDSDILNEQKETLKEIQKERVKIQTEKIEYRRWMRESARAEMFE